MDSKKHNVYSGDVWVCLDIIYENDTVMQRREIIGSIYPEKITFDVLSFRTTKVGLELFAAFKIDLTK